jgi:sugar/nucleoside kinase (ribokinase family)
MPDSVAYAIIGGLREDYVINSAGEVHLRVLGGNAVYAAAGAQVWNKNVGVVSRVGSNFPAEWLVRLEKAGINVRAVRVLPDPQDTRTFYAYLGQEERVDTDPIAHFARVGRPVPRELVDYESSTAGQDSRAKFMPLAVRPADLSEPVLGARGYHLAPADFLTHHTVPVAVRRNSRPIVTVDPSIRYMQPAFKDDLRRIVSGIDAFLPSEMELRTFFRDEMPGLWEAAVALGAMGAAFIDIKLGSRGQYLYESATGRKWHVPAYPATVRDVTGAGDAYCGGFLVGLAETGDAVEAALRGSISASLVVEGQGALYALDATPGLAEARLQSLRERVRKV